MKLLSHTSFEQDKHRLSQEGTRQNISLTSEWGKRVSPHGLMLNLRLPILHGRFPFRRTGLTLGCLHLIPFEVHLRHDFLLGHTLKIRLQQTSRAWLLLVDLPGERPEGIEYMANPARQLLSRQHDN